MSNTAFRLLFDPVWYRLQEPDAGVADDAAADHYCRVGAARGRSPTPLFDVAHYLRQIGRPEPVSPFLHYLDTGAAWGVSPHPLVDPSWFRRVGGLGPSVEVLSAALTVPYATPLNPLFRADWYGRQRGKTFRTGYHAFSDYLSVGAQLGLSPHPLFDPIFYIRQRSNNHLHLADAFEDYWALGAKDRISPHPLIEIARVSHLKVDWSRPESLLLYIESAPDVDVYSIFDPFDPEDGPDVVAYARGVAESGGAETLRLLDRAPTVGPPPPASPPVASADEGAERSGRACVTLTEVGELTVFAWPGEPAVTAGECDLLTKLLQDPNLGLGVLERGFQFQHRVDVVPGRSGLWAVRSDVLKAEGGLDTDFASLEAQLCDFALRLKAKGLNPIVLQRTAAMPVDPPRRAVDFVDAVLLSDRHSILGGIEVAADIIAASQP